MNRYYDHRGYRTSAAYRMNGLIFGSNVRIGDSERAEAINQLNEHYAAGRLTTTEHSERVDFAMAAKTQADLMVLFADLPPVASQVPEPRRRHGGFALFAGPLLGTLILIGLIMMVFWGVVILFKALPFLLVAMIVFLGLRTLARNHRRPHHW